MNSKIFYSLDSGDSHDPYEDDETFNEETASNQEKATEWWGNPDVDPYTGKDHDESGRRYNPEDGQYYED